MAIFNSPQRLFFLLAVVFALVAVVAFTIGLIG
ncbi:hypothetical protein SAMN05519103_03959 [Rhizobiales bacterium GAS113]|nr:hypothetical protein SAMN05519103_03959 [Rhizobiales bacterium GAS113]